MVSISVLIPTIGRSTLHRAIESIAPQLEGDDQLIIIGDGPQPHAQDIVAAYPSPRVHYFEHGPTHDWGSSQLDYGTQFFAVGDFLAFCGDDDSMTADALAIIRQGVAGKPNPHIFCMYHSGNKLGHSIRICEVSGQQLVVPNDPEKLPKWADNGGQANDHAFIAACCERWGKWDFHDGIINVMHTQNWGKML